MKKVIKPKNINIKKIKYEDDDFNDIARIVIMVYRKTLRRRMKEEGISKYKIKKLLEL